MPLEIADRASYLESMIDLVQTADLIGDTDAFENEVQGLGRQLAQRGRSPKGGSAYDRLMARFSASPELRAALFRLVDVAPACSGRDELAEHLAAYLEGVEEEGTLVRLSGAATKSRILAPATGIAAAAAVRQMANRFIVGETIADALPALRRFWEQGVTSTVDLLGEATVTHAEGQVYADRCDQALIELDAATRTWPDRPLLERDSAGSLPRANLSVKVTALTPLVRPDAPGRGAADVVHHLRRLLSRAAEVGAHLHIDMESMDSREMVVGLVLDLLDEPEYVEAPSVGIVLQAYLRDSEDVLDRILERVEASGRQTPLTIRLVKGAYWDHETIEAVQNGWEPPVWTEKAESDRCFERISCRLIEAFPLVRPAFASHNLRSIAHAVVAARRAGLATEDIEIQVLRGLGDDLQESVAGAGMRCRTYCPVGDMVAGMAYLVRRLLENTSNASFLAGQAAGSDIEELLRRP
jgi:RHH-type proline utilization regulon transcriptional repressor/proline dehydrogenase/delta 1-pyrroline-5-carboxylate dehydrogenase